MLDKLPQELIVAITEVLSMKDKLILMTTCRHLLDMISVTNLFSELNLIECKEKTPIIVDKFKNNASYGSQVKHLWIQTAYISKEFSTIFPNVTQVTTRKNACRQVLPLDNYSNCSMLHWRKTIEKCNSRFDWPETLPILKTTPFPRLTELVLGRANEFVDKNEGFDIPYLMPVFKNVPCLRKLTLWRTTVNLGFLDAIHTGCPHLESLILIFSHIIIKEAPRQPIQSADSLLYLEISHAFCIDTDGLFFDYIASKYRHLKQLKLLLESSYNTNEFIKAYDPTGAFAAINRPISLEYMHVYETLVNDFEITQAIYKTCEHRFFSQITPTLDKLRIENDVFGNALESLSETKVSNLDYNDIISDPKRIQDISSITSLKSLFITTRLPRQMYVFPSVGVTKLTLVNTVLLMDIDWILETFPSLEELSLFSQLALSKNPSHKQFPRLYKYKYHSDTINQKCLDYLKRVAPNVKILSLSSSGTVFTVDISGWTLKKLDVMVISKGLNTIRYYCIRSPYASQVISYNLKEKHVKEDDDIKLEMIDIISTHDQHFLFYGSSISIMQRKIKIS